MDHHFRKAGVDWWPSIEEVEPQDVELLTSDPPLDILVAHEVPAAVELVSGWDLPAEDIARAQRSRQLLQQAVDAPDDEAVEWQEPWDQTDEE